MGESFPFVVIVAVAVNMVTKFDDRKKCLSIECLVRNLL